MRFTIVTPSYNMLEYLPRCCASIRDQVGPDIEVEHIVVDGGSTDRTVEWLAAQSPNRITSDGCDLTSIPFINGNRFAWLSEPDHGMYDAINKGWGRSTGDILAWLNCDEQYLENTLRKVSSAAGKRSKTDFLYGDTLLVRPDGSPISYRKAIPLRLVYLNASHLYVHSASMFFRRRIFEKGLNFDSRLKTAGDLEWLIRVLRAHYRGILLHECFSAFTITGNNLDDSETATREKAHLSSLQPRWSMPLRKLITMTRWLEKLVRGGYSSKKNFRYKIIDINGSRQPIIADNIGFHWASKA